MSVAENFSIDLPDPWRMSADVQTRQTSRSGVIREANTREFRRVEGPVVEGWLA